MISMIEHRGRKPNLEIKERVNKLVQAGYSFVDIADTLGFKSRQMARYHFRTYKKLSTILLYCVVLSQHPHNPKPPKST